MPTTKSQPPRNTGPTRARLVLAIDPGARFVGAVVRVRMRPGHPDALLRHLVLDVCGTDRTLTRDNLQRIPGLLDDQVLVPALREAGRLGLTVDTCVAIEALRSPSGFADGKRRNVNPRDAMAVAMVFGVLLGHSWPDPVTLIPPGGNGHGALRSYPPELVTEAERARGLDRPAGQSTALRHARSAWDVAALALQLPAGAALAPTPALP